MDSKCISTPVIGLTLLLIFLRHCRCSSATKTEAVPMYEKNKLDVNRFLVNTSGGSENAMRTYEDLPVSSEMTNRYLVDGDIMLSSRQFAAFKASITTNARRKRQVNRRAARWNNNNVFYYFDDSIENEAQIIVRKALDYISDRTCIKFHEDPIASNRIRVHKGRSCSSYVGMQGGEQYISLNRACYTKEKEINYVKFKKHHVINYTPYDYGSVVHYDAKAFARSGYSLIPLRANYLRTIGSKIPSFYDMMMINAHYGCFARCSSYKETLCANGGVPNPKKCDVCLCPSGYGGPFCNERPIGCGETLMASRFWKTEMFTFEDSDISEADRISYYTCNYWIRAPQDKLIQVRVTGLPSGHCNNGCTVNAIEPRVLKDKRATNPRYCCDEQLYQTLTSKLNPTPIFSYSKIATSAFTFQYRYI